MYKRTTNHDARPPKPTAVTRTTGTLVTWLVIALATGCGRMQVHTEALTIQAASDANDNAPTTVAAVMIYDPALLTSALKMTAAQWFASRDQTRNDFPTGFESKEWEVVPGEQVDVRALPFQRRGLALLVFANYPTPGDHRARIDPWDDPRIVLQARTFTVVGKP